MKLRMSLNTWGVADFVLVLTDKGAAHLRSQNEPDELDNVLVEMDGLVDAENV